MKHRILSLFLLFNSLSLLIVTAHPCAAESSTNTPSTPDLRQTEWEVEIGKGLTVRPEVENEKALALSTDGWAALVDCRQGNIIWRRKAGYGFISRGVMIEDVVYVVSQGNKRFLAAVSLQTGETLWKTKCGRISSGPVKAGNTLVILESSGLLKCYERSSSDLRWTADTGAPCLDALFVNGDRIFTSCTDTFYVIDSKTGARRRSIHFEDAEVFHTIDGGDNILAVRQSGEVCLIQIDTGESLWSIKIPSAAVYFVTVEDDSNVACVTAGRDLNIIRLETGEILWRYRLPSPATGPPALTSDFLTVTTIHGGLYIQDLGSGSIISSIELGQPLDSSPVISSGRVYVATQLGTLVSFPIDEDGLLHPTGSGGGS